MGSNLQRVILDHGRLRKESFGLLWRSRRATCQVCQGRAHAKPNRHHERCAADHCNATKFSKLGNMTCQAAFVNGLVCAEIACWFFIGEIIGKGSIIGYQTLGRSSPSPLALVFDKILPGSLCGYGDVYTGDGAAPADGKMFHTQSTNRRSLGERLSVSAVAGLFVEYVYKWNVEVCDDVFLKIFSFLFN